MNYNRFQVREKRGNVSAAERAAEWERPALVDIKGKILEAVAVSDRVSKVAKPLYSRDCPNAVSQTLTALNMNTVNLEQLNVFKEGTKLILKNSVKQGLIKENTQKELRF
jgi:hypothetical protein